MDHCLSSRPLKYNRLGGLAGNSVALQPSADGRGILGQLGAHNPLTPKQ